MANLLQQYQEATLKAANSITPFNTGRTELNLTGFIDVTNQNDEPIFRRQKTSLKPTGAVTHLVVSNNQFILAMKNKTLFRIDLQHPERPDEVDVSEKTSGCKIYKIFLDPTGQHLLLSFSLREGEQTINAAYLPRSSKKHKFCNKMKNSQGIITAVGWNPLNTKDNTSGSILVGTNKGHIYETSLVSDDWNLPVFASNPEQYWKEVFDSGTATAITSLEFHRFPKSETKYYIFVTTSSRLFQFIGNVSTSTDLMLLNIFNNYTDTQCRFQEIPADLGYSQLDFYTNPTTGNPKNFAWMTGAGLLHGAIDCSGIVGPDSVIKDSTLMPYPLDSEDKSSKPLAIALIEFHVFILFSDRLKAVCMVNEKVVFEDTFADQNTRMLSLVKDPVKGKVWAFSDQAVFEYKVHNEAKNLWHFYLEKGEFELAKHYCKDNPINRDKVLSKQAEKLFNDQCYKESAALYGQTQLSFEEVTLKFLTMGETEGLKTYLLQRMAGLKPQDKAQLTMLVTWVTELYLNQLGKLRDMKQEATDESRVLRENLFKFLKDSKVTECVVNNKGTIYDLIASHGDQDSMIQFSYIMEDYDRVIQYHMHNGNYLEALKVLQEKGLVEMFYRYSPALMQAIPTETVNAWIRQDNKLNPNQLITSLLQCDQFKSRSEENEALRYLEFCVKKLRRPDRTIHNYLISLYVRLDPAKLMDYLKQQGQDENSVCYDLKYALRICSEFGLTQACVHIYATMGLYEEAVDLALKENIELAKENADRPEDDMELRKKLWLKIACHVVKEENDIKRVMEFLQECDLIKIEDVLPLFPDFVTIENFKDAICTSLEEYNQHIDMLQEEMNDATKSAEEIRAEIQMFRNRYAFISTEEKCATCSYPIMTQAFYVFPCHHMFHSECLLSEVIPNLTPAINRRVTEIQRQLATHATMRENTTAAADTVPLIALSSARDQLKLELDDLIAAECVYCGELMINSIDAPFVTTDECEELKSWE